MNAMLAGIDATLAESSSWSEDVSTPRLQAELQSRNCLLLDCRTLTDAEADEVAAAVHACRSR